MTRRFARHLRLRRPELRPTPMRWTAWIWAVGCAAWLIDGIICLRYVDKRHAELAFMLAALFGIAWAFYRQPRRR